jgi:hypothetical protein
LYRVDYEQFTRQILAFSQQTDKLAKFQAELLTPTRFHWLKISSLWALLVWGSVVFYLAPLIQKIVSYFQTLYQELKDLFCHNILIIRQLTAKQKIIFLSAILITFLPKVVSLVYYPITLDEAFCYIFLIDKGFAVSAVYYPGPNNHILFSLGAVWANYLFGSVLYEPVWAMRGVSLLIYLFSISAWGWYLMRVLPFAQAIAGIFLLGFASPLLVYSFLGRGYMLQTCFFGGLLWAVLRLVSHPNSTLARFIFGLSSVGGFYTLPTFLYPFSGVLIFIFLSNQFNLKFYKPLIINVLFIILITFLLYAPVILFNGWGALSGNTWVKPLTWADFFSQLLGYFAQVNTFFFPIGGSWLMGLIGIFWLLYIRKKPEAKYAKLLINCLIISPLLIIFIQKIQPFERVWIYQTLVLTWVVLRSFDYSVNLGKYLKTNGLYIFISLIIIVNQINFYTTDYSSDYQAIIQKSIRQNRQRVFINDDNYNIFFRYEYLKKREKLEISVENFDPNLPYDLVIWRKNHPLPVQFLSSAYHLDFENASVWVYVSKAK